MKQIKNKDDLTHEKRKINNKLLFAFGVILFVLSLLLDNYANLFFKGSSFYFIDTFLSIITNFGLVLVFFVVVPSIVFFRKNRRFVYLIWVAFLVSFSVAFLIKFIFLRHRPDDVIYPVSTILNYSFPSIHSMVVFSLLPILIIHIPKQKYFWILSAFLVAFSRIYLGFHFLSDVIFGMAAGFFIGNFLLYKFKVNNGNKQV